MRQLTLATVTYATDNKGRFPLNAQNSNENQQYYWYQYKTLGAYLPAAETTANTSTDPNASIGGTVLVCPSDIDEAGRSYTINGFSSSGYQLVRDGSPWAGANASDDVGTFFTDAPRNSSSILLYGELHSVWGPAGDNRLYWSGNYYGTFGSLYNRFIKHGFSAGRFSGNPTESAIDWSRHGGEDELKADGKANFSFVDGHVSIYDDEGVVNHGDETSTLDVLWSDLDPKLQ
ncbi:hypothetical protein [Poriferisphaera corsica]|nr:hypothetical protein [Poriferisphaera corsica]